MAKRLLDKPSQLIKPSATHTHISNEDGSPFTVSNNCQLQQPNHLNNSQQQQQSFIPRRQSSDLAYQQPYLNQSQLSNSAIGKSKKTICTSGNSNSNNILFPQSTPFKISQSSDIHQQQKQPVSQNKRNLLNRTGATDIDPTSTRFYNALSSNEHYEYKPMPTSDKITNDVILKPAKDKSSLNYKSSQNNDTNDSGLNLISHPNRKRRHHDASSQKIMNERRLTYTVTDDDLPKQHFDNEQFGFEKSQREFKPKVQSSVADMNAIGLPLRYNYHGDQKQVPHDSRSYYHQSEIILDGTHQKHNIPMISTQRKISGDYVNRVNGYKLPTDPSYNQKQYESQMNYTKTSQSSSQKDQNQQMDHQHRYPAQLQNKLVYRSSMESPGKISKNDTPRYNSIMIGNEPESSSRDISHLPMAKPRDHTVRGTCAINESINSRTNNKRSNHHMSDSKAPPLAKQKDSNSDDENPSRQPKFEAFIMTGDSMIKLCSSETDKQQKQILCPFTAELTPAELYLSQQQNKLIQEKSGIDSANKDELDHKLYNTNLCKDERDYSNYDVHTNNICDMRVDTISNFTGNIIPDASTTASVNDETDDKQKIAKMLPNSTDNHTGETNGQINYSQKYSALLDSSSERDVENISNLHSSSSIPKVNRSTQTQWLPAQDNENYKTNLNISHELKEIPTSNSNYTSNVGVQCSNNHPLINKDHNEHSENNESAEHQNTTSASSPVSSSSSGFYSSELADQIKLGQNLAEQPLHIDTRLDQAPDNKSITNLVSSHVADEHLKMSPSINSKSSSCYIDYPVQNTRNQIQSGKIKELFLDTHSKSTNVQKSKQSKPLFGFLSGRKLSSCDNLMANGKVEDSTHTARVHGGHNNKNLLVLSAALQNENKTQSNEIVTTTNTTKEPSNPILLKKNTNINNNSGSNSGNDAHSTSIASAAKRLFFSSNKNITNNLPHAKDECTNESHNDKESHRKHKKSSKSRKDNDLQNAYPLHAAISHDDLSKGPIPGTIRLQQSHFSSTPSVAHDRPDKITGHCSTATKTTIDEKDSKFADVPLTSSCTLNIPRGLNNSNLKNNENYSSMDNNADNNTFINHDDIPIEFDINRCKLSLRFQNDTLRDSTLNVDPPKTPTSPSQAADDRAAARRLAERLYKLDGFNESDVSQHLSRNNAFSLMVTEEYLQFFDFRSMSLDAALRKFLSKVHLNGETQERELILSKFSQHYYGCNKSKFAHWEAVQTLVCAIILLNTDLHGGHSKNHAKLSMDAFIAGLNDSAALAKTSGMDTCELKPFIFPKHMLVKLYGSIKKHPLKYSDDSNAKKFASELDSIYSNGRANTLPTRRFVPGANAPTSTLTASARKQFKLGLRDEGFSTNSNDASSSIDFKTGYLVRKRIFDANGKPTPKGKRGWKRVYITVKDLIVFMKIVEENKSTIDDIDTPNPSAKSWSENLRNSIRIHHAYASKASNYLKRDFVFHLCIADQAEYLFQASDENEMNSWIETINFATACLSAPVLPSAVGSNQKKIQRPLFPSSYTKLSFWEQLLDHDERLQKLKIELDEHLAKAPVTKKATKKDRSDFIEKIALLRHEIERYSTYVNCMRKKSNSPEAVLLSKHSKSLSSSFRPFEDSHKATSRNS